MRSKRIAVTGGIGSGKTVFCELLKEHGKHVFSCDEIYRELRNEEVYLSRLKAAFPDCVVGGRICNELLSEKVFSDAGALHRLNSIAHPLIMEQLFAQMSKYAVSFAEVPLLFEAGLENEFDEAIIIVRNISDRVASVMARSGLTREQVLSRIGMQYNYENLPAGYMVVENNGSREDLKLKMKQALVKLDL